MRASTTLRRSRAREGSTAGEYTFGPRMIAAISAASPVVI